MSDLAASNDSGELGELLAYLRKMETLLNKFQENYIADRIGEVCRLNLREDDNLFDALRLNKISLNQNFDPSPSTDLDRKDEWLSPILASIRKRILELSVIGIESEKINGIESEKIKLYTSIYITILIFMSSNEIKKCMVVKMQKNGDWKEHDDYYEIYKLKDYRGDKPMNFFAQYNIRYADATKWDGIYDLLSSSRSAPTSRSASTSRFASLGWFRWPGLKGGRTHKKRTKRKN